MTGTEDKAFSQEVSAEEAVRRYLQFLQDPSSLVDAGLVDALEAKLAGEQDVLARLRVLSAIEIAGTVDADALLADFVRLAGRFAREENVPASAFLRMGVPRDALVSAGILSGPVRRSERPASPPRAPRHRIDRADVERSLRAFTAPFTVKDAVAATGANQLTVRKTLDALLAEGVIVDGGPDETHSGPGRSPRRYLTVA